ncbi:MAG: hypothetical protein OXI63_18250 [Candidatus Poribacteria bacterium]|nr:hypothetical protein [Candidatus Poribacteria bacterium]
MRLKSIFSITLLMLICATISPLFAKAPTTPKILFTSRRDGNLEVYMMNPDGSEQVNLTQHPAVDLQAAWSPTGEQILFVSDREGTRDLYLMDADGSNVQPVFKEKTHVWRTAPTWAPDSKQFAYQNVDWKFIKGGLYLGAFGKEDAEFIANYNTPEWSPDGSEIAGSEHHALGARLTFINIHTRQAEQPLPDEALLFQFESSWSAAGDRLALVGNKHPLPVILDRAPHRAWKDKQTIYIVNRDGTDLRQLVDEAGREVQYPELSPDGSEVLYTQGFGALFIFKVDVNSRIRTQLTHTGGDFGGDWFDPTHGLPVSPKPNLLTTTWGEMKKE